MDETRHTKHSLRHRFLYPFSGVVELSKISSSPYYNIVSFFLNLVGFPSCLFAIMKTFLKLCSHVNIFVVLIAHTINGSLLFTIYKIKFEKNNCSFNLI